MEADRLSALPDELLHNVLSFLPASQAVRSSVLSRRWRRLWRSAPCLDVDIHDFVGNPNHWVRMEEWEKFARFTDTLFLLHDAPSLDRLRLHFMVAMDPQAHQCSRWITDAVARLRPAALEVDVANLCKTQPRLQPPPPPPPPAGSCGRRLRILRLTCVSLDEGFPGWVRAGCPALEDLALAWCRVALREIACGAELRRLAMEGCDDPLCHASGLAIVGGSRLASLSLTFYPWVYNEGGVRVTEAESVVRASIRVAGREANARFAESIWKLFDVRHLELSGSQMMAILRKESKKFQTFHNIRTLLIGDCDMKINGNIQALGLFLQKTPGLQRLTLQHHML
ncbi:hypothetical protein ACP70R_009665 [Stipagrostis hirtigluma subsp. patula]